MLIITHSNTIDEQYNSAQKQVQYVRGKTVKVHK